MLWGLDSVKPSNPFFYNHNLIFTFDGTHRFIQWDFNFVSTVFTLVCSLDSSSFVLFCSFSTLSCTWLCTLVHVTMRVGTLSIWRGASHMWYMSKDFLGFIHSVLKGNIVGNLWFGYNCQFYTQITQNWENLVISGLFKWHKFTSYPSHLAIYCVYRSKIANLSWNNII